MRRDLKAALDTFVAAHRGLRSGRVFGRPAAFAGRRVFARLTDEGVQLRLPASFREPEASGPPSGASREAFRALRARPSARRPVRQSAKRDGGSRAASSSVWITVTPSSRAAARLEILLEQAARYVALA